MGGDEFLFNGRLFPPPGDSATQNHGTIIDNFPKGPIPLGWTKKPRVGGNGYELVADDGTVLFSYRVDGQLCTVTTGLYGDGGQKVAETINNELRAYQGDISIF